jgi:uncharacterized protein
MLKVSLQPSQIQNFCNRHFIRKLSVFGSALRNDFDEERSDVDFLVEFDLEHTPSLFEIVNMEDELSRIIQRKADLRTPQELSRYFRQEVMDSALVQYDKGG